MDILFNRFEFSFFDILLLMGIAQCFYITLYLLFRSGRISRGGVPLVYFMVMATFFSWCFIEHNLPELFEHFFVIKWALWAFQVPLCCLLIVQIAKIYKVPALWQYWTLGLPFAAYGVSWVIFNTVDLCQQQSECLSFVDILWFFGIFSSILSLLSIWLNRQALIDLAQERNHKERYWLIWSVVTVNVLLISTMLVNIGFGGDKADLDTIGIVYALALVYLAGTSLFRIYPQAVHVAVAPSPKEAATLSPQEKILAEKIEDLIFVQKVYHEATYSRTDMARECNVSEALLSKVISVYFEQSFPQLLNAQRVEDAIRMLKQTDAPVKVIAEEVGFNSLASFNRVFKTTTGKPPSDFRS